MSQLDRLETALREYFLAQTTNMGQINTSLTAVVTALQQLVQQPQPNPNPAPVPAPAPAPWPGNRPPPSAAAIAAARRYNAARAVRMDVQQTTQDTVSLAWVTTDPTWAPVRIERSLNQAFGNPQVVNQQPGAAGAIVDANLAPNTEYFYRLVIAKGNEQNEFALATRTNS